MARAQFDREEVIQKSIKLFWQNGYSSSSMQRVVKTTGLKPGSIYLAFGNKKGLYREALELYTEIGKGQIRTILETAPTVCEGICLILEKMVQDSSKKNYCSCFLIKTQLELAAEETELYHFATDKMGELESLYQSYLEKEYGTGVGRRRAASLMLHIYGVRVYSYQRGSAERMREGLREGLPWLPWR